jgi:hypothetical protein
MFHIDLDNLDLRQWGNLEDENGLFWSANGQEITSSTWYGDICRLDRCAPFCILTEDKTFTKCGVSVPRFGVATRWNPPIKQIIEASSTFPNLTFHLSWWLSNDCRFGECIILDGEMTEDSTIYSSSLGLFDELRFPPANFLPKYMPLTLAQRGAAALDDAITLIGRLHWILHHSERFATSRYHFYRNQEQLNKHKQIVDDLVSRMNEAAKLLTFEGVFLPPMEPETGTP